jgi:hypothetical protein
MGSEMFTEQDFEDIRPYHDEEINPALKRMIAVPEFSKVVEFLFPDRDKDQIFDTLTRIFTAIDFQIQFMHPLVNSIVKKTSKGLTVSGFENLNPGTPYLFIANHRDIVLDSAILQVLLLDNGHITSEITFGSNLMTNQFIIDFGKVNRMFKVYRGGNRMELFRNSKLLSAYIRYTLTKKRTSIWIAQRSGRTKDGNDKTESGLLKMFNISGTRDFEKAFGELNIVPLCISYEYEPCCAFKVRELMATANNIAYQKKPGEDLTSIITGITQQKGRIHFAVCTPLNRLVQQVHEIPVYNDKINKLTTIIDEEVYKNYKLWPANYIAFDILNNTQVYSQYYTSSEKEEFIEYVQKELSIFKGDITEQKKLLLKIYANPVINANHVIV